MLEVKQKHDPKKLVAMRLRLSVRTLLKKLSGITGDDMTLLVEKAVLTHAKTLRVK